jgi:hypothetical protein
MHRQGMTERMGAETAQLQTTALQPPLKHLRHRRTVPGPTWSSCVQKQLAPFGAGSGFTQIARQHLARLVGQRQLEHLLCLGLIYL